MSRMILQTSRTILKEFALSDDSECFELNNDPMVLKYTGDDRFESLEKTREFLKNYPDYRLNGFGRWKVVLKDSNQMIGWCGLKKHDTFIDLGYRFRQSEWGKGYATETSLACLKYGFKQLNMDEIVGRSHPENVASIRVLEKIGMKHFKTDRCLGVEDAVYLRILKENFNCG